MKKQDSGQGGEPVQQHRRGIWRERSLKQGEGEGGKAYQILRISSTHSWHPESRRYPRLVAGTAFAFAD